VVYLFPGDLYGAREAPPGQTIISIQGGKPELKPETATSISASLVVHPRAVPGLDIAVSYFNVRYRSRVVSPISSTSRALIDPIFADFVRFNPSASEIASTIALSPLGLNDQTGSGATFDPSSVYAIVDARSQNVSRDRIKGVDLSLGYQLKSDAAGIFVISGGATYLTSARILIDGVPELTLAGTVFNPPHFKARGGVSWSLDSVMVNGTVNYIGGVTDNRLTKAVKVRGMTSFDLSIKKHVGGAGKGGDIQLSALNLFNAKPAVIRGSSLEATYDSTNYSAIGRYLSLSLTKDF
jgi:outer membrane receptor protein involved in Fe transport